MAKKRHIPPPGRKATRDEAIVETDKQVDRAIEELAALDGGESDEVIHDILGRMNGEVPDRDNEVFGVDDDW